MRRWLIGCVVGLVTVGVVMSTSSTISASGKGEGAGTVESEIREINKIQRALYLEDGTGLEANDPRVLDQLTPGIRVRASYEERAGRKLINRLEVVP